MMTATSILFRLLISSAVLTFVWMVAQALVHAHSRGLLMPSWETAPLVPIGVLVAAMLVYVIGVALYATWAIPDLDPDDDGGWF